MHFNAIMKETGQQTVQFHMLRFFINVTWMIFFVVLKSENHVNTLLTYVRSKHTNIKNTCLIEKDNSLTFLDIKVHRSNNSLKTSMQSKSIFLEFIPTTDLYFHLA